MEKGVPEHLGLEKGADKTETESVITHFIIWIRIDSVTILFLMS